MGINASLWRNNIHSLEMFFASRKSISQSRSNYHNQAKRRNRDGSPGKHSSDDVYWDVIWDELWNRALEETKTNASDESTRKFIVMRVSFELLSLAISEFTNQLLSAEISTSESDVIHLGLIKPMFKKAQISTKQHKRLDKPAVHCNYWIYRELAMYYRIHTNPAGNYMFIVNNRNTRRRCEICSELTIMTPERRHWRRPGIFVVNFEHISHLVLVFLLWTLSR